MYIVPLLLFIIFILPSPVLPEVPDTVSIRSIPSSSLTQHEYLVVCQKLGEQHLVFTVGNGPTSKNKMPADETIAIKYALK